MVVLSVCVAIVGFSECDLFGVVGNAVLRIIKSHLDPVGVCICVLTFRGSSSARSGCVRLCSASLPLLAGTRLLRNIVEQASLLLFRQVRISITENVHDCPQKRRLAATVLAQDEIAPRAETQLRRALHLEILVRQKVLDRHPLDEKRPLHRLNRTSRQVLSLLHLLRNTTRDSSSLSLPLHFLLNILMHSFLVFTHFYAIFNKY